MKPGSFLIPVLLLVFLVVGCSKNNSGKAKISLQSFNYTTFTYPGNVDSMVAVFKFENGSSLQNGTFVAIRHRLNTLPLTSQDSSDAGVDTLSVPIPQFNGANSGTFRYSQTVQYLSMSGAGTSNLHINDTLDLKFFALTPDSVSTDTVTVPKVIIINP